MLIILPNVKKTQSQKIKRIFYYPHFGQATFNQNFINQVKHKKAKPSVSPGANLHLTHR